MATQDASDDLNINERLRSDVTRIRDAAVLGEQIIQLKRTRSGYKATLTRIRNELLELMKHDQNIDDIKLKYIEMDETVKKFDDVHINLHSLFTEDNEVRESEFYYKLVNDDIELLRQSVKLWIRDVESKNQLQLSLKPEDSISQVSSRKSSKGGSTSSRSTTSSTKRMRIEEAARRKSLEKQLELFT